MTRLHSRCVLLVCGLAGASCDGDGDGIRDCIRTSDYDTLGDFYNGAGIVISSVPGRFTFAGDDQRERVFVFSDPEHAVLLEPGASIDVSGFQPGESALLGGTNGEPDPAPAGVVRDGAGSVAIALISAEQEPLVVTQHRNLGACREPRFADSVFVEDAGLVMSTSSDSSDLLASGDIETVTLDGVQYLVRVLVAFDRDGFLSSRVFLLRTE